ncbi:MAG: hypothetical protein B0D91_03680 [Oceanospirillales bacterium LUC14_002_19_P2]|nr:MAG: hypothetical protein B0D91_03680 [Oceanospirillales bacterium LUC14_002_19_P2]
MIGKHTHKGLVQGCQFKDNKLLLLVSQVDGLPGRWMPADEYRRIHSQKKAQHIRQHYPLIADQLLAESP